MKVIVKRFISNCVESRFVLQYYRFMRHVVYLASSATACTPASSEGGTLEAGQECSRERSESCTCSNLMPCPFSPQSYQLHL